MLIASPPTKLAVASSRGDSSIRMPWARAEGVDARRVDRVVRDILRPPAPQLVFGPRYRVSSAVSSSEDLSGVLSQRHARDHGRGQYMWREAAARRRSMNKSKSVAVSSPGSMLLTTTLARLERLRAPPPPGEVTDQAPLEAAPAEMCGAPFNTLGRSSSERWLQMRAGLGDRYEPQGRAQQPTPHTFGHTHGHAQPHGVRVH